MVRYTQARRRERSKGRHVLVGWESVSCAESDMNGRGMEVIGSGGKAVPSGGSEVTSQLGTPVIVTQSRRRVAERVSQESFARLLDWSGIGDCKV